MGTRESFNQPVITGALVCSAVAEGFFSLIVFKAANPIIAMAAPMKIDLYITVIFVP